MSEENQATKRVGGLRPLRRPVADFTPIVFPPHPNMVLRAQESEREKATEPADRLADASK